MKKISLLFLVGTVLLITVLSQSCGKEKDLLEPSLMETSSTSKQQTAAAGNQKSRSIPCALEPIVVVPNLYWNLLLAYPLAEILNGHWACTYPMVPAGDCCPPAGRSLDRLTQSFGGMETWGPGPGYDYDYLSDGVISPSEQQDLIDRAIDLANNNAPLCRDSNGNITGQLVLAEISFSTVSSSYDGIAIQAYATYVPVCYGIFTPQMD